MSKIVKYLLLFLLFDAVVIGGYLLIKSMAGGKKASDYEWITVDEAYAPRNAVEEFIKSDAAIRNALPVQIKDYGQNAGILKRFKGRQFAQPTENVLALFFKDLDDWMVVDIKYKAENEREVVRTMLYIFAGKQWRVGDAGTLMK